VVIAIVAVLAGLLLPALAAAREKARRTACLGNLNQMGTALESYCSDYGMYYPCMPAYAGYIMRYNPFSTSATWRWLYTGDDGIYTDPRLYDASNPGGYNPGRVRTNGTLYPTSGTWQFLTASGGGPNSVHRCIFTGEKGLTWERDITRPAPVPGELNLGPNGLGYLLVGNYVGDARVFYCPSAGGSMPIPIGIDGWGSNVIDGVTSAKQIQQAGGFDARSIMYGDFSSLGYYNQVCCRVRAVFCDYAYRNTPVHLPSWGSADPNAASALWKLARLQVAGTRPGVETQIAAPAFKTQKLLGGRALVADSFGRTYDRSTGGLFPYGPDGTIGDGWYAHRDGYNVLYGDWHVKWYGDPQQEFIWWPVIQWNARYDRTWNQMCNTQRSGLGWWKAPLYKAEYWSWGGTRLKNSGTVAWHLIDMSAGIDVDVDAHVTWQQN